MYARWRFSRLHQSAFYSVSDFIEILHNTLFIVDKPFLRNNLPGICTIDGALVQIDLHAQVYNARFPLNSRKYREKVHLIILPTDGWYVCVCWSGAFVYSFRLRSTSDYHKKSISVQIFNLTWHDIPFDIYTQSAHYMRVQHANDVRRIRFNCAKISTSPNGGRCVCVCVCGVSIRLRNTSTHCGIACDAWETNRKKKSPMLYHHHHHRLYLFLFVWYVLFVSVMAANRLVAHKWWGAKIMEIWMRAPCTMPR